MAAEIEDNMQEGCAPSLADCNDTCPPSNMEDVVETTCEELCIPDNKENIVKGDYDEDLLIDVPPEPEEHLPIEIGIVTEEIIAGNGQFDKYMRAIVNQIEIQFDAGRIKGADIASLFGELIPNMMAEANKYILAEYAENIKADMTAIQIEEMQSKGLLERELLSVQIVKEQMAIRLMQLEMDASIAKTQLLTTQEKEARLDGKSKRMVNTKQANELIAKTQLLTTQESEARLTGSVDRMLKASQADESVAKRNLIDTQRKEAVSDGISKRSLTEAERSLKETQELLAGLDSKMKRGNTRADTELKETEKGLKTIQGSELILNGASKRKLEGAQKLAADEQVKLYEAQATSFKNKDSNDTLKTLMNGYAVVVSENSVQTATPLDSGAMGTTINSMKGKVNLG